MPYKYNESRRHKIEKSRYKVTNWHDYNNGLRRRGDITIWFTKAAIAEWRPIMTGARGRPQEYSDIAIETVLFIRQVFRILRYSAKLDKLKLIPNQLPDFLWKRQNIFSGVSQPYNRP